jgi:protein TonB
MFSPPRFSTVLDESEQAAGGRRRMRVPVGVGIGLHAAAALLVLAARVWTVEEVIDPPFPIIFVPEAAPPLGDGGEGERPRLRAEKKADAEETPAKRAETPVSVADEIAASPTSADTETTAKETPGGGGGSSDEPGGTGSPGDPNGLPGGTPGALGDGPGGAILVPGGNVREPVLILRIDPVYPDLARRTHQEGLVVLTAIISASGVVEEVHVVKSAHPLLDAAAMAAVEKWRYKPATLYGRPVRVLLSVTVTFSLH